MPTSSEDRCPLDVSGFDSGQAPVHLVVHRLKFVRIFFQFPEFLLQGVQIAHCISQGFNHRVTALPHLVHFVPQLFHLPHLLHELPSLFLPLLLELFPPLYLLLPLDFFLFFFLDLHNAGIHFYQKVGKFAVNFVH